MLKVTSCGRKCTANKQDHGSAHDRRHIMTSPGYTGISRRDMQTSAPSVVQFILSKLSCYAIFNWKYYYSHAWQNHWRLIRKLFGIYDTNIYLKNTIASNSKSIGNIWHQCLLKYTVYVVVNVWLYFQHPIDNLYRPDEYEFHKTYVEIRAWIQAVP